MDGIYHMDASVCVRSNVRGYGGYCNVCVLACRAAQQVTSLVRVVVELE